MVVQTQTATEIPASPKKLTTTQKRDVFGGKKGGGKSAWPEIKKEPCGSRELTEDEIESKLSVFTAATKIDPKILDLSVSVAAAKLMGAHEIEHTPQNPTHEEKVVKPRRGRSANKFEQPSVEKENSGPNRLTRRNGRRKKPETQQQEAEDQLYETCL